MDQILRQTKPICLAWNQPDPLQEYLPDSDVVWPHSGFCLDVQPAGITRGRHALCIDQGYTNDEAHGWCEYMGWQLNGLLLFQLNAQHFEVIPLASEYSNRGLTLPEVQLAYDRVDGGWAFKQSSLGPVNALFHEPHMRRMDEQGRDDATHAVEWLGSVVSLCLGTLYKKLSNPLTTYNVFPAKEARVKLKGDKIVKIYRPATVGHLEII